MSRHDEALAAVINGTWTGLVRSGTPQDTVHRADCSRLGKRVLPWQYAEGKSREEIATAIKTGLKFCKCCRPLEGRD